METATTAAAVLPDDLLAIVLGRLPVRSLAASCRVCKAWRDLIDERQLLLRFRRILPHSVGGLFINYQDYDRCHFLSLPTPTPSSSLEYDVGPRQIDGEFGFIRRGHPYTWYEVVDHCNGLVLFLESDDEVLHVCNPTTRWSARLPPYPESYQLYEGGLSCGRAFLVFDPFVSPEYKVLLSPPELEKKKLEKDAACRRMEWPPSAWKSWHEFSSSTGRWVEKAFVREGEPAGTAGDLLQNEKSAFCPVRRPWRYGAYWQGALYIHCHGEYVSRFSLLDDKYRVIKSPIQLAECMNHGVRSFLGRSEKGVYFAAIASNAPAKLRVWTLSESGGQMEWVPKDQSNHKINTYSSWWWMEENNDYDEQKYWIFDHDEGRKNQDVSQDEEDVCWNSDDDNIIYAADDEQDNLPNFRSYFRFLGFHPYKEVIFLCCGGDAVALHLNTPKVQYLGKVYLKNTYNCGLRESFVYTPCLIGG